MSETPENDQANEYETVKLGVYAYFDSIDWTGKLKTRKVKRTVNYTYSIRNAMRLVLENGNYEKMPNPIDGASGTWSKIRELFGVAIPDTNRIIRLETDEIPETGMKYVLIDKYGDNKPGWKKAGKED
jgi:hypothetical protein